jgi:hypothetical protein
MKLSSKLYLWGSFILILLLLIVQTNRIWTYQSQIEMVSPSVAVKTIQYGLVQLEGEIQYQQQHNWDSAEQLVIKTQYILEGIGVTIETGRYIHTVSNQDMSSLWNLYYYLYNYIKGKGNHDLSLNDADKKGFQELGTKLRANGWGIGIGYSSAWEDFMKRLHAFFSGS